TVTNSLSNIQYLSEGQANQFRTQNQLSDANNTEHVLNGRLKWQIDSTNRLDFTPNIRYTYSKRQSATDFNTINVSESPINKSVRSSDGDNSKDRKSTRLNSSHVKISYAVFCLKKKTN